MCEVAWCSGLPGVYFPCLPKLQTTAASLTTAWRDVRANSNSPVGSIAITEPLLYPCNCKGSCFLSDQTASQPPGRLAPSPLAAPGKWGHFAGELNKGWFLIERRDSYLVMTFCSAVSCAAWWMGQVAWGKRIDNLCCLPRKPRHWQKVQFLELKQKHVFIV